MKSGYDKSEKRYQRSERGARKVTRVVHTARELVKDTEYEKEEPVAIPKYDPLQDYRENKSPYDKSRVKKGAGKRFWRALWLWIFVVGAQVISTMRQDLDMIDQKHELGKIMTEMLFYKPAVAAMLALFVMWAFNKDKKPHRYIRAFYTVFMILLVLEAIVLF